jgi:hypothetical protein
MNALHTLPISFLWPQFLWALLLLPLLVLLWATESTEQRIKRLRSYGWAQRRIAEHMNITRYRVRQVLA